MDFENLASLSVAKSWRQEDMMGQQRSKGLERVGTYNEVIRNAVRLAPGTHDKGIVVGDHDDLVDALGLQSVLLLEEGRDVLFGAGGREGTGHCDQDNLLALELCDWGGELVSLQLLPLKKDKTVERLVTYPCWHRT